MKVELLPLPSEGFGFLHRACGESASPTLVLVNAGLIHRVGPFRMHVDMAERLTANGVNVVRIDLPGTGDTRMDPRSPVDWLRGLLDVVEEHLPTSRGIYVGGLCSAADRAWKLALVDPRVSGLVLLDPRARRGLPFAFGTARLLAHKLRRDGLVRVVAAFARRMKRARVAAGGEQLREWTSEDEFLAGNLALTERGVRIFAFFSGSIADYFTDGRQAIDTFGPETEKVRYRHFPEIDHTMLRLADRDRVISEICDWMGASR